MKITPSSFIPILGPLLVPALAAVLATACGDNLTGTVDGHIGGNGDSGSASGDGGTGSDGGNTPGIVQWTLANAPTTPATFSFIAAFQDGDGAWAIAPTPPGDIYSLPVTSDHYGVAFTCISADGERSVTLAYFTVAEQPSLTTSVPARCSDRVAPVQLTGAIKNAPLTGRITLVVADRTADATASATIGSDSYTLEVPPDTYDVLAIHQPISITPGGGSDDVAPDKIAIKRAVDLHAATTLDFDFSTAVAPVSVADTVALGANGKGVALTELFASNTDATLSKQSTAPFTSAHLAASQALGTDVYAQTIEVTADSTLGAMTNIVATPTALTYVAPTALGAATATIGAAAPYPQVKLTWHAYADTIGYVWRGSQTQTAAQCGAIATCAVTWTAQISPGSATATPTFQVPDLSVLAGWSAKFEPVTGTAIDGSLAADKSSAGAADFVRIGVPPVGTKRSSSTVAWTVTP